MAMATENSSDKFRSCVPYNGELADIIPAEQQIQKMAADFATVVCKIVESIVPVIECCVESMVGFYDEILRAYPNKRVVWLAFCHKSKKTRKKNRHRIERHLSKIVWLHNR